MAGADGSNPQPLTPDYPKGGHLVRYVELIGWSADSKKIACVVGTSDALTRRLHIIDVPSRQIIEMNLEKVGLARWVPGSSRLIALFGFEDFIFDINTQKPSSKKFFSDSSVTWPGFMPDGKRGYDLSWEGVLTVYEPDGSVLYKADLDFNPPDYSFFTWSPDGKWFVFLDTDREEETLLLNIYKLNQENPTPQLVLKSSQVSVTSHPRFDNVYPNIELFPVWSPDGKWFVVFNLFGKAGTGELYVINVETNEVRTVMTISPFEPALEGIDSVVWLESQ
jgi:Tol biopolymer transport system component